MVQLDQPASLQFELLEVTNLPVAPDVQREKFYVVIRVGSKDGGVGNSLPIKTTLSVHKFKEEEGNRMLVHYGGVDRGEKATISVQVWEKKDGAPDELLGSNTVDIGKILSDARFDKPEAATVLVRLKDAGATKGPRGEVKLNVTFLPPLRAPVRLLGKLGVIFEVRDSLVDRLMGLRNLLVLYTWGYVKGPAAQGAKYVVSNRKILFTSAATGLAVLFSLFGLLLAFLIPAGLITLFTFPLWIVPLSLSALFTSPVWVPILVGVALFVGALSSFVLLLALSSPPIRSLAARFFYRFRESPTGKRLLFTPVTDEVSSLATAQVAMPGDGANTM